MLHASCSKLQDEAGFTLIEISIVVAVVAVIAVVSLTNLFQQESRAKLDSSVRQIATMLREAQSRSIAQEDGTVWGIHFENPTSTTAFYALFRTAYAAANVVGQKILPNRVRFSSSSIVSGGSLDVTFAQITGLPSTSTSIGLELTTGGGGATAENVSRESSGKIFFDDFNRSNL